MNTGITYQFEFNSDEQPAQEEMGDETQENRRQIRIMGGFIIGSSDMMYLHDCIGQYHILLRLVAMVLVRWGTLRR